MSSEIEKEYRIKSLEPVPLREKNTFSPRATLLNKQHIQNLWGETMFNLYQKNFAKQRQQKQETDNLPSSINVNTLNSEQVTADILRKDLINLARERQFMSPSRSQYKLSLFEPSIGTTSMQQIETLSDSVSDSHFTKDQQQQQSNTGLPTNSSKEMASTVCGPASNETDNKQSATTNSEIISPVPQPYPYQESSLSCSAAPSVIFNMSEYQKLCKPESQSSASHDPNVLGQSALQITANEEDPCIDQATAAAINLHRGQEDSIYAGDLSPDEEQLDYFQDDRSEENLLQEYNTKEKFNNQQQYEYETDEQHEKLEETVDEDTNSKPKPNTHKMHRSSAAWKMFFSKIRRLQQAEHSASSYLENRSKVSEFKRSIFFDQLLARQSDQYGQYIHLQQNKDFALISAANREIVDAVRMISHIIGLRPEFQMEFPDLPSVCVFPSSVNESQGHGSTEPLFEPFSVPIPGSCSAQYAMEEGVYTVYWSNPEYSNTIVTEQRSITPNKTLNGQMIMDITKNRLPSVSRFLEALKQIMKAVQHPACKAFSFQRLLYLKNRFQMHLMFNTTAELDETKKNKHRDFYNVRKVDTHVHHSACMNQKHLLRFIRRKYLNESDEIVAKKRDGKPVTLHEIFHVEVGVSAWDASVDLLNVHALGSCFHRFDIFNLKYNPFGQPLLREVFLKTNNMIEGRYLAEITQEVLTNLEEQKYQMMEWRVSIYGKSYDEWSKLAKWVHTNRLTSKRVRWMVQVPRLYHVHRKLNLVSSFAELLKNIFEPLFEAVINPEANSDIYYFLLQMNGWDSVDDESIVSKYTSEGGELPIPEDWIEPTNPPYSYWAYYMYANIRNLNVLLASRGMRTLPFRPHCGEAGSVSHLASMYLLANSINHGIVLRKTPVLQYLYYLQQIGLAISPLSNNALFHDISKNPFYNFFCIGLNVSLSTDDPLMFHFTDEPLLEEYSCCAHVWKLSPVDLCEIARNSVLQSHFEPQYKKHWLGDNYTLPGKHGNDMKKSNVSNIRLQYRDDTLISELAFISDVLRIQKLATEFI